MCWRQLAQIRKSSQSQWSKITDSPGAPHVRFWVRKTGEFPQPAAITNFEEKTVLTYPPHGWTTLQKRAKQAKTTEELIEIVDEMNRLLTEHEKNGNRAESRSSFHSKEQIHKKESRITDAVPRYHHKFTVIPHTSMDGVDLALQTRRVSLRVLTGIWRQ